MEIYQLKDNVKNTDNPDLMALQIDETTKLLIYKNSVTENNDSLFFIAKYNDEKYLFILSSVDAEIVNGFEGERVLVPGVNGQALLKRCSMNTINRKKLQETFSFTIPVVLGLQNSFGFGDRIGLANAAHIRSVKESNFRPVLAQQSIRELTRTNRTADEVMDAAVWAVFQEGYKDGFGADADHLRTTADIDMMLRAGYKMLTFDPSDHVDNNADHYSTAELSDIISSFSWNEIQDTYDDARERYLQNKLRIDTALTINPSEADLMRAYAKYGRALIHIKNLNEYLRSDYPEYEYDIEVSVDETDSVTSVFEHFFISNELTRLGVNFISLALRFIGDFEKGIDYRGDLNVFKAEYIRHLKVVEYFGSYKISLHSGSDKFSVYEVIGSLRNAVTHVKTAGTSYLEALKVVAIKEPSLFRDILDFSRNLYSIEKKTYHVSADLDKVDESAKFKDNELLTLFNSDDARQVLHVTFGKVLTEKNEDGSFLFKEKIISCLKKNEETHYKVIKDHFDRHLKPFKL